MLTLVIWGGKGIPPSPFCSHSAEYTGHILPSDVSQKSEGFETYNNLNTENASDLKANMIYCLLRTDFIKYQWKKYH